MGVWISYYIIDGQLVDVQNIYTGNRQYKYTVYIVTSYPSLLFSIIYPRIIIRKNKLHLLLRSSKLTIAEMSI